MGSPRMKAKMAIKKTCRRRVASALTTHLKHLRSAADTQGYAASAVSLAQGGQLLQAVELIGSVMPRAKSQAG